MLQVTLARFEILCMTALLASVRTLREASIAVDAGCDWLDLKEPRTGALGALPRACIARIVARFHGQLPISATIGDCWDRPKLIPARVAALTSTGVDYLKVGLFVDQISTELECALRAAIAIMPRLIAVCFVEAVPRPRDVARLATFGFVGVMLDTADKVGGALPTRVPATALQQFVGAAREHRLLVGLAGSLRTRDVAELLPLGADYLGFRGALCQGQLRTAALAPEAIRTIRRLLAPTPAAHTTNEESNHGMARTQI
ncbi:MAG: hypothetical protein EXR86_02705 [Gammaproteobacteria bacterium]|nr:hypothetical protein [Gammaproteobacteria bacterium]